jgi:leader peptidase (prepilin peptidase)/N-methyltransferase
MTARRLIVVVVGSASLVFVAVTAGVAAVALARLAVLGAALGAVVDSDLAERRIPNRITMPATAVCAAASAVAGIAPFALIEGLVLVAVLLALDLVQPESIGMGDVKLALLLVVGLDGRGWLALLVALALAAGFGILVLLRHGRAGARRQLPLAPFFAAGAVIVLLA